MPTFIPGQLATVTINSENLTLIGSVFNLNISRNVIAKKHFGTDDTDRISGKRDINFSANGNISAEQMGALNTLAETAAPVTFSLQIGTASAATDAGLYSGSCIISNLTVSVDADGDWAWSLDAGAHGVVTYTPAGS